jgi:hypothetical protein
MTVTQQGHIIQHYKGDRSEIGCVKNKIHLYETGNCYGQDMNRYSKLQKHTN